MTLREVRRGERVRIVSLTDPRFVRAALLLGLVDGAVATVEHARRDGSVRIHLGGTPLRVPGPLSRRIECRPLGLPAPR